MAKFTCPVELRKAG